MQNASITTRATQWIKGLESMLPAINCSFCGYCIVCSMKSPSSFAKKNKKKHHARTEISSMAKFWALVLFSKPYFLSINQAFFAPLL